MLGSNKRSTDWQTVALTTEPSRLPHDIGPSLSWHHSIYNVIPPTPLLITSDVAQLGYPETPVGFILVRETDGKKYLGKSSNISFTGKYLVLKYVFLC